MPPKAFRDCEGDLNINLSTKIFDADFPAFLISAFISILALNINKKILFVHNKHLLEKSVYCCLTRFRSGFPKLFQIFQEFFSHASLYFMSHLLSFFKSFAFCVFHTKHKFSKNKKTHCSEYLTSEFIDYNRIKR